MLLLDKIGYQHKGTTQRYQFTLSVKAGNVIAISGRSGSGKSTLLDLIAGFLIPHSGALYWHGENITTVPVDKRPLTIVFQNNNLFEHRSALDNVVVGINPSVPKAGPESEKARQALIAVGLAEHINKRVSKLSGGQRQRVALARASLRKRAILLLDEPFSALDAQTRAEMLSIVRNIADTENSAVIMVTHDLRDSRAIADAHYELTDGKLHSVLNV